MHSIQVSTPFLESNPFSCRAVFSPAFQVSTPFHELHPFYCGAVFSPALLLYLFSDIGVRNALFSDISVRNALFSDSAGKCCPFRQFLPLGFR
jgi:hypothetical protein